MWRTHFKGILNSFKDFTKKSSVLSDVNKIEDLTFHRISPGEIAEVVKILKLGKAAGFDNLSNEHLRVFMFSSHRFLILC